MRLRFASNFIIYAVAVAAVAGLPGSRTNFNGVSRLQDNTETSERNQRLKESGLNAPVSDARNSKALDGTNGAEVSGVLSKAVNKIIGGHPATPGSNPYQVSIQVLDLFGSNHICGGALINEFFVLTVAQCVTSQPESNLQVVAGDYSLSDTTGFEQVRGVEAVTVHPNYAIEQPQKNDIAIIKVPEPFTFDSMVASIPLGLQDVVTGEECITTGWGSTSESGSYSDILMEVGVLVLNDSRCDEVYGDEYGSGSMLCAGDVAGEDEGRDFCQGDEGGPMNCGGYLQGLASWGVGCGRGYPGVYTRVYNYTDWIEEVILSAV